MEQGRAALVVIPVFLTEHCPDALGAAPPSIRGLVAAPGIVAKRHFSALNEPGSAAGGLPLLAGRGCGRLAPAGGPQGRGRTPTSAEKALFEWAGHAGYPAFRAILSPVKSY